MKTQRYVFLILLAGATALASCGGASEAKKGETLTEEIIPVRLAPVARESAAEPVKASGLVASETEARLSFKTGGIIQKIYVKEGDAVRRGQLLAVLNLTEINAQVQQATEAVGKAERDLGRVKNLYRDSVATLEQVQNLTTALNVARNNLDIATYNRGFSEIRANTNGVVMKKLMNEGELAAPGAGVLLLSATDRKDWIVKVGISDKDWVRLKEGNRAEVRLDAYPGQTYPATVSNLSVGADAASGMYLAELKLAAAPPKLASGIFANALIFPVVKSSLTAIPVDALIEGSDRDAFVYVAEGDRAIRRAVKVAYLNADKAFLQGGLDGVSEVITDGSAYLTEGAKIRVVGGRSTAVSQR